MLLFSSRALLAVKNQSPAWPEKVSFRDYLLFLWQALLLFSLVELSPVQAFFAEPLIERLGEGRQENQHLRSLYIHGSNIPHKYGQNASLYPSFEEF